MARPKKNTAPETTQATKTDTVMVALNRTTGITFPMPDGRKVLIEGNAASLRGKEKGVLPVGAFGLTRVNADDWAYIEKTYGPHMEIFKSGLIFAQARKADAVDEADPSSSSILEDYTQRLEQQSWFLSAQNYSA